MRSGGLLNDALAKVSDDAVEAAGLGLRNGGDNTSSGFLV